MKTKIFLGAYVNFPNAQNVNCDHIAKHLDKEKFEVHTLYTHKRIVDKAAYKAAGIHLHKLIHHRYIWFWCKLFAMWKADCDIYYLPKMEQMDRLFAKWNRNSKKLFISSVEGVVGAQVDANDRETLAYYELMDDYFSISDCIRESVKKYWGVDTQTLHLGVDELGGHTAKTDVKNIIWTGSMIERKRPQYLIEIAKRFPHLHFTMVGNGDMDGQIQEKIAEYGLKNVTLTGRIPNEKVYEKMQESDLLLMTSEFEGLPKVIQEAAQCGLPSIYMAENYKVDFLKDGVNGYEAYSLDQMMEKLTYLLENPDIYREMSQNAAQIIQEYTWENLIPKYEEYFLRKLEEKRKK